MSRIWRRLRPDSWGIVWDSGWTDGRSAHWMDFWAIFGLIIGMFVGSIGGLLLAIEIYCWRRWLSPRNLGEDNLYWLAPSSIGLSYLSIWCTALLNDDHYQQQPLAGLLEVKTFIYAIGPSLMMAITIRLILPKILKPQTASATKIKPS